MITLDPKTLVGKPDLFQFVDYRTFLSEYVEWKLKANPSFSRRAFSQKYFGSTGILYSVIGGDRDMGPKLRLRCAGRHPAEDAYRDAFERTSGPTGVIADLPIWDNKIHQKRPILCDGDGPIGIFRTWCKQFYSEAA